MANKKIKHIIAKLVGSSTEETMDVYDVDAVHTADVINNLTSNTEAAKKKPLSAYQGYVLNNNLANRFVNVSWGTSLSASCLHGLLLFGRSMLVQIWLPSNEGEIGLVVISPSGIFAKNGTGTVQFGSSEKATNYSITRTYGTGNFTVTAPADITMSFMRGAAG